MRAANREPALVRTGARIPDAVLKQVVSGVNLAPGTLGDQLGEGLTLLVFLRHFGCIFCRETLADLRALVEQAPDFPQPLVFFQGSSTEGRALLRREWPKLRAVSDPKAELYEAFGVGRGGLLQMFGPAVWAARSRAAQKGHANGARVGDVWRMPGMFLVRGSEIVWAHEYRHAADHPDYAEVGARALEAGAGGR